MLVLICEHFLKQFGWSQLYNTQQHICIYKLCIQHFENIKYDLLDIVWLQVSVSFELPQIDVFLDRNNLLLLGGDEWAGLCQTLGRCWKENDKDPRAAQEIKHRQWNIVIWMC